MTETTISDLIDVRQAAKLASVSVRTVWEWSKRGVISSIRIGQVVRFDKNQFRKELANFTRHATR